LIPGRHLFVRFQSSISMTIASSKPVTEGTLIE
jgi:hypothetical protein